VQVRGEPRQRVQCRKAGVVHGRIQVEVVAGVRGGEGRRNQAVRREGAENVVQRWQVRVVRQQAEAGSEV